MFERFSNTVEFDPDSDVPFRADMNSIHVGTTQLGRCDGTFTTVRREPRQVIEANDDRFALRATAASGPRLHAAVLRRSDIAFECGFNDLPYLNRCFRPPLRADADRGARK